jgi:hypothetical protein
MFVAYFHCCNVKRACWNVKRSQLQENGTLPFNKIKSPSPFVGFPYFHLVTYPKTIISCHKNQVVRVFDVGLTDKLKNCPFFFQASAGMA